MPEGPEIKCIAEVLQATIAGKTLLAWDYDPQGMNKYHQKFLPGYEQLKQLLPLKILAFSAKGKKIVFWLEQEIYLISSLGMTGGWVFTEQGHTRITLTFDEGPKLHYEDARLFGGVEVCFGTAALLTSLSDLGPCLLNEREQVTAELWREKFRNKRLTGKQVKSFLLDQSRFSFCGNYLASEVLYVAGLLPYRTLGSLSDEDLERLRLACFQVIDASYAARGFTIENFLDPFGNKGTYKPLVYGRKTDDIGNPIMSGTFKDQRTSWYCPAIQH